MAKYAKQTMEDNAICPYCGNEWTSYMDGDDEQRFRCDSCHQEYYIMFDENSWTIEDWMDEGYYAKTIDVTDRHRKSLLEE